MNNIQRDDLMLSLVKGLNNLQESLNVFRKDVNNKIDSVEQKLTSEIRIQSAKIDALAKDHNEFKEETRNNFKEVRDDLDNFKDETRNNFKEIRDDLDDFKEETRNNFKEVRDDLDDFKEETRNNFKEFRDDLDDFKEETRNNFKEFRDDLDSFRKEHKDFKKETDDSLKELIGISGSVFDNVYSEIKNHLNQHDTEIAELKVKLA